MAMFKKPEIAYNNSIKTYSFDLPNHNVNKSTNTIKTYNQLFVDNKLHVLNINTGELHTTTIDLNFIPLLKQYNFGVDNTGRFKTCVNGKTTFIYEIIYGSKTNENWVINHIDNNLSNNQRSNLELVTQWFNAALKKTDNDLPLGVRRTHTNNSFRVEINLPTIKQAISFCSLSIDYLQNIHYQFATKSKLVSPDRYLESTLNWLPDNTILFTTKHQEKLNQLIAEHLVNQARWGKPELILTY